MGGDDSAPVSESQYQGKSLARIQAVPWLIVILLMALTAWLGWRAFFYQEEGDPVGSAMLAFEKQNSLTVFSSRFEVVAESVNTTSLGPINLAESRQAAIIPATIEYRLDLSTIDRDRFNWDAGDETLDITLPALKISKPNLDEAQQKTFTEGVWVSRGASENLSRENSRQAEVKAAAFAKNPQVLAMARSAAKEAVRQNLTIPLQIAGYGDVTVNVRFDGEKVQK
ncbi:hypothetical protein GCM10023115_55360 [Pontixanthobacter gangjinensis]|uniref:DUF4230 domain-containing protein n=1 Tax=Pontixanthobacter gangjinensis TaxID=1028742 RepID=A0A6I4SS84_9SPHN|nr:DUF4230 domain-containing protein [Pontixanthobacter gangjinensis]MXO57817.1 DUF4230 domain-containing protein [Pontixanthobacter gangjinensis]